MHESETGPSRHFAATHYFGRFREKRTSMLVAMARYDANAPKKAIDKQLDIAVAKLFEPAGYGLRAFILCYERIIRIARVNDATARLGVRCDIN
jgi:hypothetical protein